MNFFNEFSSMIGLESMYQPEMAHQFSNRNTLFAKLVYSSEFS